MIDTPDVLNDPAWAPVPPFETEVFQPGDYRGLSWTNEMTSQMVSNYNNLPEEVTWRAQTTVIDASEDKVGETDIGHDNRDLRNRQRPSLGVIEKLKESGDKVVATLRNVPRFMHDCIKRGIFPSVSLTVYRDGKDEFGLNGPVPRGLSYLGAEPPQLKKLRKALDILSEEGGDVTRIEGITFADETVAGVNPANNIKSNLISFSMKGNEMPENTVQPEAPPVTPPADEAPVDSDARLTALEEQMAAIVGLLEAMQPEADTVADEAGEVTTPQTEFSEWVISKFAEMEDKEVASSKEAVIQAKVAQLRGKGLAVDEPNIRKFAERTDDIEALIMYCDASASTISVPGKSALTYSDSQGHTKSIVDIQTEMFNEHGQDAASHLDEYVSKYGVSREDLIK